LKTVTNPENKITLVNKFNDLTANVGLQPDGLNDTGTMIVTPAKPADKDKDLEVFKAGRTVDKGIDVNPDSSGTCQFQGISRLVITIESISGQNQGMYSSQLYPPNYISRQKSEDRGQVTETGNQK
jgi:hypothetical protein